MSFQQGHQFPGSDFLCDCVATVCVTVNKCRSHPVCRVTALRMTLPILFYFIPGFFFLVNRPLSLWCNINTLCTFSSSPYVFGRTAGNLDDSRQAL